MNARKTLNVNEKNHLAIGGCDAITLAEKFGTPLYVMDEEYIRLVCRSFKSALEQSRRNAEKMTDHLLYVKVFKLLFSYNVINIHISSAFTCGHMNFYIVCQLNIDEIV